MNFFLDFNRFTALKVRLILDEIYTELTPFFYNCHTQLTNLDSQDTGDENFKKSIASKIQKMLLEKVVEV